MDNTPENTRLLVEVAVAVVVVLSVLSSLISAALLIRDDREHRTGNS